MNKPELIKSISEKSGLSKKDSEIALDAFINVVSDALVNGDTVKIVGFGNFTVKDRAERNGRNPSTGEEITIPAKKLPIFKFSKNLKDAVK